MTEPQDPRVAAALREYITALSNGQATVDDVLESDLAHIRNCLARALAAADAVAGEAEGWRPIETAPKDGTEVLLFGPHGGVEGLGARRPHIATGYWDFIDDAWCGTCSTWLGPFYRPTHWRPRPATPSLSDPDR